MKKPVQSVADRQKTASDEKRHPTDWFRDCRWGVFCHYLADPPSSVYESEVTAEAWHARVDGFDVAGLVDQLAAIGAPYFFITLGQDSGHYLAPNAAYDRIVGRQPSRCARRDLVAELAAALAPRGIPLLVYFTCLAPGFDRQAQVRLSCLPPWRDGTRREAEAGRRSRELFGEHPEVDERMTVFQNQWEEVIREWSLRWGRTIKGWWMDGCYYPDKMYRHPAPPNFRSLIAALKAGNPDSLVAFNFGHVGVAGRTVSVLSEGEDYTAGEVSQYLPVCRGRWVDRAQFHVLSYLGETWGRGTPRFPDSLVIGYTQHVSDHEGVVSWDTPIQTNGLLPDIFIRQLRALRMGLSR